ncbi:prephenate dehydratase [Solirubrobacter sp. CPCC 204708]|uniref:Prephenate dehydratase n=1 Tax=Solirubrobacter deserti TaxID=2282478 RepID=A0ABT4RML5_9ACTN|nr:prephenate dehydratase [Solirubrobacter deserti]MBE2316969.1 prephenate dehydratase [Solirubrobacter deserti]MDA0139800.1 prephenate dehydratase [Solirubrobacter deserti]
MRVAFLGPPGTVSDEALNGAAPEAEGVPLASLRDVVLAVQEQRIERALVPIENALEGGVDPVLDCLALEADGVSVVGEVVQPVSYCLAAGRELALEQVTMVLSHPQALGQCKRWIAEHLPHAAVVPAASTAEAVRIVAEDPDGTRAAIGPRLAARRYGAVMLAEDCEDDPGNATRFGWVARTEAAPPAPDEGPAKTMLVFWGSGSGSPGWLVSCLAVFAFAGVNLTRIESRPLRRKMGEYMFFLDLEGSTARPAVAGAVADLHKHAQVVRVLGSFGSA